MLSPDDLRALVERAPVLLWRTDPALRCEFVSAGWLRFTGQTYDQAVVGGWLDGIHPDDLPRCRDAACRPTGRPLEYRRRHHDGTWRWLADHVVPREHDRPDAGLVGAAIDVSAYLDAAALRTHRLAELAHELRAPLNGLTLWLELLRRQQPVAPERPVVATAARLLERMSTLVRDLGELARVERGHGLELDLRSLDLAELASDLVALHRSADADARQGGIVHQLRTELTGPARVHGDRARLAQVVQNLIENAVKYSPAGGDIRIALAREGGFVQLRVSDQGIGVPAADLPHLRERFFRATNATRAGIPGTGLGLAIIEEILAAHGGRLDIASAVGFGTTVIVSLPEAPDADRDVDPAG